MDQGVADPSIVVVKLRAEENMVTCLRIKLTANSHKAEGKGMDMLTRQNSNNKNYGYEIRKKKLEEEESCND
jgi:hypothetical protein